MKLILKDSRFIPRTFPRSIPRSITLGSTKVGKVIKGEYCMALPVGYSSTKNRQLKKVPGSEVNVIPGDKFWVQFNDNDGTMEMMSPEDLWAGRESWVEQKFPWDSEFDDSEENHDNEENRHPNPWYDNNLKPIIPPSIKESVKCVFKRPQFILKSEAESADNWNIFDRCSLASHFIPMMRAIGNFITTEDHGIQSRFQLFFQVCVKYFLIPAYRKLDDKLRDKKDPALPDKTGFCPWCTPTYWNRHESCDHLVTDGVLKMITCPRHHKLVDGSNTVLSKKDKRLLNTLVSAGCKRLSRGSTSQYRQHSTSDEGKCMAIAAKNAMEHSAELIGAESVNYVESDGSTTNVKFSKLEEFVIEKTGVTNNGHVGVEDAAAFIKRFKEFDAEVKCPWEQWPPYAALNFSDNAIVVLKLTPNPNCDALKGQQINAQLEALGLTDANDDVKKGFDQYTNVCLHAITKSDNHLIDVSVGSEWVKINKDELEPNNPEQAVNAYKYAREKLHECVGKPGKGCGDKYEKVEYHKIIEVGPKGKVEPKKDYVPPQGIKEEKEATYPSHKHTRARKKHTAQHAKWKCNGKCQERLPQTEFARRQGKKDRNVRKCISCTSAEEKERSHIAKKAKKAKEIDTVEPSKKKQKIN